MKQKIKIVLEVEDFKEDLLDGNIHGISDDIKFTLMEYLESECEVSSIEKI